MDELIRKSACDIVALLQAGEINTDDTLDALAARIEASNPKSMPCRPFASSVRANGVAVEISSIRCSPVFR